LPQILSASLVPTNSMFSCFIKRKKGTCGAAGPDPRFLRQGICGLIREAGFR
jgi:hypothetical protein